MYPDFFILASEDEELKPLKRHLRNVQRLKRGFESAQIVNSRGDKFSVLLYPNGCGQGTNKAAVVTTEAILRYHPHIVILIGVTAGFHENQIQLGDVLVPDFIDPYELAKETPSKPPERRQPGYPTSAEVVALAKSISLSPQTWYDLIIEPRPPESEHEVPRIHAVDRGVVGSGDKNLADKDSIERKYLLECHKTKALGFEMEAAGVATSCRHLGTSFCVIKGVQDNGTAQKDDHDAKDRWRPYAEDAAACLTALVMRDYKFADFPGRVRSIPSLTTGAPSSRVVVRRLNPTHPSEIAATLLALYQIDMTFPPQDRYGLKLLSLLLRQPDAFWIARVGPRTVGYLSIYRMTSRDLWASLIAKAHQGTLDLPNFNGKILQSVDSRRLARIPKSERIHLYIDALIVKETGRNVWGTLTANLLINRAKSDLAELINKTDSIATIASSLRIENLIRRKWPDLTPIGIPVRTTKKGVLYRHLFRWERTLEPAKNYSP